MDVPSLRLFKEKINELNDRVDALETSLSQKQAKEWVESTLEADKSQYSEVFILYTVSSGRNTIGNTATLPLIGVEYDVNLSASRCAGGSTGVTMKCINPKIHVSSTGVLTVSDEYGQNADARSQQVQLPGGSYGQTYTAPSYYGSLTEVVKVVKVLVR